MANPPPSEICLLQKDKIYNGFLNTYLCVADIQLTIVRAGKYLYLSIQTNQSTEPELPLR